MILETDRLELFAPHISHLSHLISMQKDARVMQFLANGPRSEKEVYQHLKTLISYYKKEQISWGTLFEKKTGAFVGQAGLAHMYFDPKSEKIEVAYMLDYPHWNKGYATEITKALVNWAFSSLECKKLIGVCRTGNIRSQRVLLKCGFTYLYDILYNEKQVCYHELTSFMPSPSSTKSRAKKLGG